MVHRIGTLAVLLTRAALTTAEQDMSLTLLTPTSQGGRCLDGTPAGYYLRKSSDSSLFVVYLEGGGTCSNQADCASRAKSHLGSSKYWAASRTGGGLLNGDCTANPDFCNATAVYVA
jgi:hypothetical protein